MKFYKTIKGLMPPFLWDAVHNLRLRSSFPNISGDRPFVYIPEGWAYLKNDHAALGWNVESIFQAHRTTWATFVNRVRSTDALDFSPEAPNDRTSNLNSHNTVMVFAYALAIAAHQCQQLTMLDWGGSIGQYFVLAQTFMPDLKIEYYCREVSSAIRHGQELLPEAHFIDDDSWRKQLYDFVLASGSLQYVEDWKSILKDLAKVAKGYLLVTRFPIIQNNKSFVFLQRLNVLGCSAEYLGWSVNKTEFLDIARENGLCLLREFLTGDRHAIHNAPELPRYYGFLFRKNEV